MVAGADTLLDVVSDSFPEVFLEVSTKHIEGFDVMEKTVNSFCESGACYNVGVFDGMEVNSIVWLCDVTRFVFGDMPDRIYAKVLRTSEQVTFVYNDDGTYDHFIGDIELVGNVKHEVFEGWR